MSKDNPRRTTPRFDSETDFNPSALIYLDWREELVRYLVTGGVMGRKQSQITQRLTKWVSAKEVVAELEAYRSAGKVQKFIVEQQGLGRAAIVWQATNKILK